jgi:hypothetical protein
MKTIEETIMDLVSYGGLEKEYVGACEIQSKLHKIRTLEEADSLEKQGMHVIYANGVEPLNDYN